MFGELTREEREELFAALCELMEQNRFTCWTCRFLNADVDAEHHVCDRHKCNVYAFGFCSGWMEADRR